LGLVIWQKVEDEMKKIEYPTTNGKIKPWSAATSFLDH